MKIKNIDFDKDANPAFITVQMTVDQAAYLAKLTGRQSHLTSEEVMVGGGQASNLIYECLVGSVFNPYFEDGVDEYIRER